MNQLPRSTPQAEGVSEKAIYDLLRYYDEHQTGVQSIMILRHDKVISESWWYPYRFDTTHSLFSLSKSFTSIAVGFAVQEGLLSIEDKLISFFPDVLPKDAAPCRYMQELTVRDVLRMATGHVIEPSMNKEGEEKWIYQFLSSYIEKEPGTHYLYNTSGTYMLSAMIQRLTNMTVEEYLTPRLFKPLGFKEWLWEKSPEGVSVGGSGLNLCTEDIAKFGVFLRNEGSYNGQQLLDPNWIREATAKQMEYVGHPNIDSRQGYGYQFWRCQPKNSYRGAGAFAQFCIVLPDQEMVIAVTSGAQDTQPVLTALWDILLPGVDHSNAGCGVTNLPLSDFSKSLTMPMAVGTNHGGDACDWNQTYTLSQNPLGLEEITFHSPASDTVSIVIQGKPFLLPFGYGKWNDSLLPIAGLEEPAPYRVRVPMDNRVSCCGAWTCEDTFELRISYYRTPFTDILTFQFDAFGFLLHHRRKTGFNLVDDIYYGRPKRDQGISISENAKAPRAEFRF